MPQATPTSDALYQELSRRLPSWAFRGLAKARRPAQGPFFGEALFGTFILGDPIEQEEAIPKDPVYGPLTALGASFHEWFADVLQQTRIGTAEGDWLDLHAQDRGTARDSGEPDEKLRRRLRRVPDIGTEAALREAVLEVLRPGKPSGWGRFYWGQGFWGATRLSPDVAVDVFTLRNRFLAWTNGNGQKAIRRAWGRGALWGTPVFPQATLSKPAACFFWGLGYWGAASWTRPGQLRGPAPRLNPFAVAVVVIPRQTIRVRTYWSRGMWWSSSHWGGSGPDLVRYRAIRERVEATRAAGVQVEIWIKES